MRNRQKREYVVRKDCTHKKKKKKKKKRKKKKTAPPSTQNTQGKPPRL